MKGSGGMKQKDAPGVRAHARLKLSAHAHHVRLDD